MARKARVLLLLASLVTLQITFCGWTTKPVRFTSIHHKASRSRPFSVAAKPEIAVFDKIFEDLEPHDVYNTRPGRQDYLQRLEDNNLAIIDRVTFETMTHEVIDFDVKHWSKLVLDLSAYVASPKKSFLATVRGSGGGKTRALEELRWELLGMEGVLPLAFTYNSAMELYPKAEFGWSTDYELNYAMTVVARLATVFYGVRLAKILPRLDQTDWASMLKMEQDADFPLQLIRGFLSHAVKKLKFPVHTVVVLADEVVRAEEAFVRTFDLRGAEAEVTSILRKAVLDQEILPDLQATLVISSLTLSPPDA